MYTRRANSDWNLEYTTSLVIVYRDPLFIRCMDVHMRGAKFGPVSSVDTVCSATHTLYRDLVLRWQGIFGITGSRRNLGLEVLCVKSRMTDDSYNTMSKSNGYYRKRTPQKNLLF